MSDRDDMAERHRRNLAELAELGMSLAREVHQRALSAEDAEEGQRLTLAFHRICRCVRQTMALEARLERDRRARDAAEIKQAADEAMARLKVHEDRVRAGVERLVWSEHEDDEDEFNAILESLDYVLRELTLSERFEATPVEELIREICDALGVAAPDDPADEPRPPPDTRPPDPAWGHGPSPG